jgi:hypothetical protein
MNETTTIDESGDVILFTDKERAENANDFIQAVDENRDEERAHRSTLRKDWDTRVI